MPTTVTRRTLFERDERGRLSGAIDVTIDAPPPREEPAVRATEDAIEARCAVKLEQVWNTLKTHLPPARRRNQPSHVTIDAAPFAALRPRHWELRDFARDLESRAARDGFTLKITFTDDRATDGRHVRVGSPRPGQIHDLTREEIIT